VINAGRLAVVLGIEVSVLFDCGEILDVPQCTAEEIDERLQEVYDMGVRQMELVNKFDNALSGVTGDGGIHRAGRQRRQQARHRPLLGHADLRGGRPQPRARQRVRQEQTTSPTTRAAPTRSTARRHRAVADRPEFKGFVAPLYPAGPHCNTRGLTELGEHLIRA
jgi:hypothetical protein